MKRSIIYSLLFTLVVFAGCRKEDNPKIPALVRVPTPLITKDANSNQVISAQEPDKFAGKFFVDLYFKDDVKPQKFDIVVVKNGNKNNVKLLKADVSTFPSTETVTGTQLTTLFGPIVLGDQFDIGADITTGSGQKFEAFPAVGVGYGAGVGNQVGASTFVRYSAVCNFDATKYTGDFVVLEDGWEDYVPGTVISVSMVNATTVSFLYGATDAKPILVKVNPASNETSVTKQDYGKYGANTFFVESVPDVENFVAPCDGILSVNLHHTTATSNYGNYLIKLKKK